MDLSYGLYMAEAEGYLNTRESKIQRIIKRVKAHPESTISVTNFYIICDKCGIDPDSLTRAEIMRIQNAIKA